MKTKFSAHVRLTEDDDAKSLRKLASSVEDCGLDGIFLSDNLASSVDPLTALACFASATRSVSLGTCVYLLPLRNPLTVAKQVSFLQRISKGRLTFGVGVGGRRYEFDAVGVPFRRRGLVTDEALKILSMALKDGRVDFQGEYFRTKVRMDTACVAPQIWVGGNSDAAIRRAARFGDGWVPTDFTVDEYRQGIPKLRREFGGRRPRFSIASHLLFFVHKDATKAQEMFRRTASDLKVSQRELRTWSVIGGIAEVTERLAQYNKAGVDHHVLSMWRLQDRDQTRRVLKTLSRDVIPSL